MSLDPRLALGRWRAAEGALEIGLPMLAAGAAWVCASRVLEAPTAARPLTGLELAVLFGASAAITGWMAGRQLWIAGRKNPWGAVGLAAAYTALALILLPGFARDGFSTACAKVLKGEIVTTSPAVAPAGTAACRLGGIPDNPYLPGALLRPSWGGDAELWLWGISLLSAGLGALALRDRRIRPSAMARKLFALLQYAPAAGSRAAMVPPPIKEGRLIACANPTLWGEICGQLYSADRVFAPGESCARCGSAFKRAEREIVLKVVTLFSADPDVLNGLEKTDTVSWRRDEPMTPDARVSGAERWVTLGTLTLPDVVTAATALAIVHSLLPGWGAVGNERTREAVSLALARASRVSAWLWFGSVSHRLTYARPTDKVSLAIGPTRLRDLVSEGGEEVWLQLDVGLLPVELFYGFRKSHAGGDRPPELQNSKADLWVPIAPPALPKERQGIWIPRVEGEALRAWLSTERLREDADRGVSIPLPYLPWPRGEEAPADPYAARTPTPGSLDLVRMPLDKDGAEPTGERSLGDSIADWDWLEWEQIQLLRRQTLVLISRDGGEA